MLGRGGVAIGYDANGNVTYDPATGFKFSYSSENLLKSVDGGAWRGDLIYDPLMRLLMAGSNSYTRSFYDGEDRVAEYYGAERSLLVVHGPGIDEPLITYDDVNGGRYLYADERGSIIAGASDAGTVDRVYAYDEFGMISAPRRNRFEFTGHVYESVSGLLYARNRFYNPALGRFMQPDPIGYDDGPNMYARTNGDPVNFVDPWGLKEKCISASANDIVSCGKRTRDSGSSGGAALRSGSPSGRVQPAGPDGGGGGEAVEHPEILVVGKRLPRVRAPRPLPRASGGKDWCGGSDWTRIVPEGSWSAACRTHDRRYDRSGTSQFVCDVRFGRDVLVQCTESTYIPLACVGVGAAYMGAVRNLGFLYYKRKR